VDRAGTPLPHHGHGSGHPVPPAPDHGNAGGAGGAGGACGAGGAGGVASSICSECGGNNKKHKRVAGGNWCSKSKRARSAEKLKAEGDSAF